MRAVVMEAAGQPPRVVDLEVDPPGPGEVAVRMTASGICHSDLHVVDGEWPFPGPFVLGHEGAGTVEAVGPGVQTVAPGQFVVLNWLYPCLRCEACQSGEPWTCTRTRANDHVQQDGTTRLRTPDGAKVLAYLSIGTLAERSVAPAQAAVPVPEGLPPAVAALIGCCVSTGVGAVLNTARIPPGASVAVIGLGGVGLSVVMGAALAGAHPIVAVDKASEKLDLALRMGATAGVTATGDRAATIAAIHEAAGAAPDFVFEAVGLAETVELTADAPRRGGTAVLVGLAPDGVRASFDINEIADGSRRIIGSNYGSTVAAVDFPKLARLYLAGKLPIDLLIEERISPEQVGAALDAMRRGEGARRVVSFEQAGP